MASAVYGDFARAYLTEVAAAARRMFTRGSEAVELLQRASAGGMQIRAFGNGGSSAIVRSVLLQLPFHTGQPMSDSMMSTATMAYGAHRQDYRTLFAQSLAQDIDEVGLVVTASVSGRSTNVVEAVRFCQDNRVPVLALVGGDGTQMEPVDGMVWATGTTDQQVSEDAMLTALALTATALGPRAESLPTSQERHLRALASVDTALLAGFLYETTEAVTEAIRSRRCTYVLCPDGGPLALAGEHFAHNLSWDAPLGVEGVQPPLIMRDPSLADMSAMFNDHPDPAYGVRHQLSSASPKDVVFLLTYDSANRTTREAISAAAAAGTRLFLLHRDGPAQSTDTQCSFTLPKTDHFAQAALAQSIAHLVCRTTRAALARTPFTTAAVMSSHDLMAQDLAPLRELSDIPQTP
ncbi:SIS domain-containing protein [Streptomyces sp. HSW2009]|uniref:SIS domain-containing protein n=1 Tax=Streptomyces sp. HSW2009 TaxID=3142890 RepID=UPI0032EF264C